MVKNYLLFTTLLIYCVYAEVYEGPWRKSLESCWAETVSSCNRVMTCAHGGEWNVSYPYDSLPAFKTAFEDGADAVKGDFRVSEDNVGMVMHSSPIEAYESLNCFGKYVEKMTAAECEKCKMALTEYTFISVPEFLQWANAKINVMLCVKASSDIPRAISTLIENNATHRAFLELGLGNLLSVTSHDGWDNVYYVVELDSTANVEAMLAAPAELLARTILFEFNNWDSWSGSLQEDIQMVQSQGRRTFAATNSNPVMATVENHLKLYNAGFDVAYTYNLTNAVQARHIVNAQKGIFPAR